MKAKDLLEKLGACDPAVEWVENRTVAEAWRDCEHADWMMWGLARMAGTPGWPTRQDVARLAAMCARTALRFVPKGDGRPLAAIEAAERWAEFPTDENRRAAYAAYAAAYYAARYAAADAAAYAAAAYAAAYAAYYAAYYAAADAANAANAAYAAASEKGAALREMADMIRAKVPTIGGPT